MNLDGKRRTRASFEAQREPRADRPAAVKEDSWLIFSYWRSSRDHDYCSGVPAARALSRRRPLGAREKMSMSRYRMFWLKV